MSLFSPAPFLASKLSYASAIASITNKSIYVRGDSYGGSNGTAITSANWTNEGSAGGAFSANSGSIVWEINSQNGMPGVKNAVSGGELSRAIDYNTLHGTNGAMTLFVVAKRAGSQGGTAGAPGSASGRFFSESSGAYVGHTYAIRSVGYYVLSVTAQDTALSYADGVPHVIGIRINALGHYRVNFNSDSVYSDTTSRAAPSSSAGNLILFRNNNASNNYLYECIATADVLPDALIDNIVIALKEKWGIT